MTSWTRPISVRLRAFSGPLLLAALVLCTGCTTAIDGRAIANHHPVIPSQHVYNLQDFVGRHRDAASVAAQLLAYGYADVRYANNSSRVPSAPGCTPHTEVGVYGVDSDGVVWLETFADEDAIARMLFSMTPDEITERNERCTR